MEGWIKLHRKLNDSAFKNKPLILALFIDLLTNANHQENKMIWNKNEMVVGRGQLITGRKALSIRTCISQQSIRTGLSILKSTNTITIKIYSKFSLITILNWDKYQISTNTLTNNQPATNQQLTTNNNDKNVKNDNIERDEKHPSINYLLNIPSNDLAEFTIAFICTDRQVISKGQGLYDYCQSKGKVYKDYKAFLRNALRTDFGNRIVIPQFNPDLAEEMSEVGLERLRKMKEEKLGRLKN